MSFGAQVTGHELPGELAGIIALCAAKNNKARRDDAAG